MASPLRVLLVDDHPAFRMGLRLVLGQAADIVVVAEASTGADALALAQSLTPDVVVLDYQLPDLTGDAVARVLRARGLSCAVLALSAYTDEATVQRMVQAGALGYLVKEEAPAAIVDAVRAAARGEGRWSAAVASKLAASHGAVPGELTAREQDVVRLLARGWDNRRIARELHIGERTVRFHLRNIFDKIDAQSRTEAAVWAVHRGLAED
ncbi:MAG: response regulator transcription factor [Anaerolineae bacterium]